MTKKHPDRARWYISALISIALALGLAAGVFVLTAFGPSLIWGDDVLMVWLYLGIPLGGLLALISLPACLLTLPDLIYRILGGRRI